MGARQTVTNRKSPSPGLTVWFIKCQASCSSTDPTLAMFFLKVKREKAKAEPACRQTMMHNL